MDIRPGTRKILNDESRIARRDAWFARLEAVFAGKVTDTAFAVDGIVGRASDPQVAYTDPERWVVECLDDLADRIAETDTEVRFAPPCIEYGIFGVHFVDRILGAEVFFQDDQWYNHSLTTPVGSLPYPDLDRDPTCQLARRAALHFAKQGVRLPLFGLPTIASTLNIAVNLYGQEILVELLADPDNARRDLATIHRVLCDLHRWYRAVLPARQLQPVVSWNRTQPPGHNQVCGCTTQLISADMYRAYVAPLDEEVLSIDPQGGMIHLCGSHSHLIPVFRDMKSLRAVQMNDRAAHDLEQYFLGLRDDQVIYLNPCEGMPVEKAMGITKGRRLVIAAPIEEAIPLVDG